MPNVRIRIPTPLRPLVEDRPEVEVEARTVGEALERLTRENERLRAQLYGEDGELRNFVNVYVGDRDARELGHDAELPEDAELSIVPSIAGGASGPGVRSPADGRTTDGDEGSRAARDRLGGRPLPELEPEEVRRYGRHLSMPEVGREGQRRLKAARVLMVGAGGLGSPVGMYLAAAGVGELGIVDFDEVEFSNLHRQLLHDTDDVGRSKLESARERIGSINPEVRVREHPVRLTSENALGILEGYDLVVDGSDNFPTRYLVNDACVMLGVPNVYGAIFRFEGQASVFGMEDGPCYRCLFREPPPAGLVPSCAEAGVLGVLPGLVGAVQATEAIKLILGRGEPLRGRLLLIDTLEMSFREVPVRPDPACPVCGEDPSVTELIDYEAFCGVGAGGADGGPPEAPDGEGVPEIDVHELARRSGAEDGLQLLDVREEYEWEIANLSELGARRIPLGELPERLDELSRELDPGRPLVVHCRSGGRSARAVELLRDEGYDAVNLAGGILAWAEEIDPEKETY